MVVDGRFRARAATWLVVFAVSVHAFGACGKSSDDEALPGGTGGSDAGRGGTGNAGNAGSSGSSGSTHGGASGAGAVSGAGGDGDPAGAGGEAGAGTGGQAGRCNACREVGVEAGPKTSCVLHADSSVQCWGADTVEYVGGYKMEGVASPPAGSYTRISLGLGHGCALTLDGELVCWGCATHFDPDFDRLPTPIPTGGPFVRVSSGHYGACVIDTERRATCWGASHADITAPEQEFVEVAVGERFACGIGGAGEVVCWGYHAPESTPEGEFRALSAEGRQICGIRVDGTLACWGQTEGDVPDGSFEQIAVGARHACGLRTNQSVTCWGLAESGRLAAPDGSYIQLSAGENHTCATRASGGVVCWGVNEALQASPPPAVSLVDDDFVHFSAGGAAMHDDSFPWQGYYYTGRTRACGLRADGSLQCFGDGAEEIARTAASERFTQVSAGYGSTCAITASGDLLCWGALASGVPDGEFTQVSTGFASACAVRSDGALACWGGTLRPPPSGSFTQVSVSGNPVPWDEWSGDVPQHACALRSDQSAVCWGQDWQRADITWPSDGGFDGPLVDVVAGYRTDCALRPDGTAVCAGPATFEFGSGGYESIGRGSFFCGLRADDSAHCYFPSPPGTQTLDGTFMELAVAGDYVCGVRPGGNVSCFGGIVR